MTKEYLVEYRIKNNLLFDKIKEAGFETIASFSRASKIPYHSLNEYLSLRASAYNKKGELTPVALKIMDYFGCKSPFEVFTMRQISQALPSNKKTFTANEEELLQLNGELESRTSYLQIEEHYDAQEKEATIERLMEMIEGVLTIREEKIIKMYHGIDCEPQSFRDIGKQFGVTIETIRQSYLKSIKRLQNPKVKKFVYDLEGKGSVEERRRVRELQTLTSRKFTRAA